MFPKITKKKHVERVRTFILVGWKHACLLREKKSKAKKLPRTLEMTSLFSESELTFD